jgi:hypothetical protein
MTNKTKVIPKGHEQNSGFCFHCLATWQPKSIKAPVKCPRCWMPLDADPEKCNCKFCLPRRQAGNPLTERKLPAKVAV